MLDLGLHLLEASRAVALGVGEALLEGGDFVEEKLDAALLREVSVEKG